MKAISALLWQTALVLLLLIAGWAVAATLVAGFCIGFWFCVLQLALAMGEER